MMSWTWSATEELLGKDAHSDEKNNKFTYVTIHGLDKSRVDAKLLTDKALRFWARFRGRRASSRSL